MEVCKAGNFTGSGLSYDSLRKVNLISGNTPQVITPSSTYQLYSYQTKQTKSPSQHFQMHNQLSVAKSDKNVHITFNKLSAVCMSSQNTELVVCEQGYSSGLHYWEFLAHFSCKGLEVGIIKDGYSKSNQTLGEFISFNTSTPRVIGVLLDLQKGLLRFWLNNSEKTQKQKSIKIGEMWYPALRITGKGNWVTFNPFALQKGQNYVQNVKENLSGLMQGVDMSQVEQKLKE